MNPQELASQYVTNLVNSVNNDDRDEERKFLAQTETAEFLSFCHHIPPLLTFCFPSWLGANEPEDKNDAGEVFANGNMVYIECPNRGLPGDTSIWCDDVLTYILPEWFSPDCDGLFSFNEDDQIPITTIARTLLELGFRYNAGECRFSDILSEVVTTSRWQGFNPEDISLMRAIETDDDQAFHENMKQKSRTCDYLLPNWRSVEKFASQRQAIKCQKALWRLKSSTMPRDI